jgi:2-methylisocitrate lyase-like PEP mutase family enzyme
VSGSPASLRSLIATGAPLIVPSVYDGISALVATEFDFPAVYVGSYATGATRYGLPDIGYIGVQDMADQVRRISDLIGRPIIADAEGGFGNPLHVARTVRTLERAGAAAVHVEDHDFGKHISSRPEVIPVGKAVDKVKAALDARDSDEFLVIARTDSSNALGPQAALERAVAFQEAGADGVFLARYGWHDDASWTAVREAISVPVFNTDLPDRSAAESAALGVDVILYYALSHLAAVKAIRAAFSELADTGTSVRLQTELPTPDDFDRFLGIEAARTQARRYGLLDQD